jgi:hypothetical protein
LKHGRATEAEADPTEPGGIDLRSLTQHLQRGVGSRQQLRRIVQQVCDDLAWRESRVYWRARQR